MFHLCKEEPFPSWLLSPFLPPIVMGILSLAHWPIERSILVHGGGFMGDGGDQEKRQSGEEMSDGGVGRGL